MRRRLLILGAAAAVLGALLWSVAPALSLQPYVPAATDFEQPVTDVERVAGGGASASAAHGDEGAVRFRSGVIDAPARFDLAGVGGELRPLEFRARTDGGEWSDWIETANGDPVYFGGADQLQVRSRGVRPEGRIHYVNVSGSETVAGRVLTGARTAVNSALIAVTSVASASAEPRQPEIYSRKEWGASRRSGGCRPRSGPVFGKVKAATVHHTVTGNSYTAEEAPGIVLGICRYHRNGNGWNDVGYNFLVDRFGTVYEGRSGGVRKSVVGAHAQGFNAETTGIASIGTHTSKAITDDAANAFVRLIAWKLAHHGVPATGRVRLHSAGGSVNKYPRGKRVRLKRVFGHRRVNETACPGAKLKRIVDKLARRAQRRIDENGGLERS